MRGRELHLRLGIDASNIRAGGGITHLGRLLGTDAAAEVGFSRVVLWGGQQTLDELPASPWLEKIHVGVLDGPLPLRFAWQRLVLQDHLRRSGCDVLLAPGGILPKAAGVPSVVISQNLLPFELSEMRRYPWFSFMRLKLRAIRRAQMRSMQMADGLIFLTACARSTVLSQLARYRDKIAIIPHGIEDRYRLAPRPARHISTYSSAAPFRLIYISTVDVYKHQWQVARAVASLRAKGYPVALDLIGPAYPPALRRLRKTLHEVDPRETFVRYHGTVPFAGMHHIYHQADGLVFASTCENLPNILLEGMAAGLPIACSDRGPMPEILGQKGIYFDPEDPFTIETALQRLLENRVLRGQIANQSFYSTKNYTWQRCARDTFSFVMEVAKAR